MRLFQLAVVLLLCYLAYDIFYGRNGIQQYQQEASQVEQAEKKVNSLVQRNQRVKDEIEDLQQGNKAIEELARSELGLIKPTETFYRVIEKDDKAESKK
ncbi:MAG: cell division protein FtsB [Succinivibrio sp.]|nr:cell division protein FtsB [Succinivibrio sp.]